ncbi:MAG: hypothetical protein P1V81_15375 [Planctomycetota bacterium]|nr:hypothetical protein [Planctomycetota bacterium]
MRRLLAWLRDGVPAAIAGAFLLAGASLAFADKAAPGQTLILLVVGGLYALAVRALMGFLPLRGGWSVVSGLLCGPLPAVILLSLKRQHLNEGDRGGLWLMLSLTGLFVGLVEAGLQARATEDPSL